MKYVLILLLLGSQVAHANLCDDQLNHVWNMYELAGRAVSMFQKLPSEVQIVAIEDYKSKLIQVDGNMECAGYVDAEETVRLHFLDLPDCMVTVKMQRNGSMTSTAAQPEFKYIYGDPIYDCSALKP